MISALVVTIFSASSSTYRVADTVGALQETGRVAMDSIDRDVQMAGFRGCNSNNVQSSGPLINVITAPTAYSNDLATPIQGYEYTGPGWTPALPAAINAAAPAPAARLGRSHRQGGRRDSGDSLGSDGFCYGRYPVVLHGGILRQRHRVHRGLQRVGGVQDFSRVRRHEPPPYRRCQQQRLGRTACSRKTRSSCASRRTPTTSRRAAAIPRRKPLFG